MINVTGAVLQPFIHSLFAFYILICKTKYTKMNYSSILKICFDNISSANDSWDMRTVMGKCKTSPEWFSESSILIIFSILGVISLVSLCMVFVVYWVIPELNNLHGKIVLSNALSIAFLTSFLLTVYNADLDDNDLLCKTVGYFGYFSSISMFL